MEDLKKGLYKLPFSKHNNPNGWIEPTTFCQLKCPHCYRGADKDNFKPTHRDIKEVLSEVDELIKIRNIQTYHKFFSENYMSRNLQCFSCKNKECLL